MPKYIELDTAIKIVSDVTSDPSIKRTGKAIRKRLKELPESDVVEVVRCKNCAIPHNKFTGCPCLNGLVPLENHFCSYGKRKEGAEE